jgi:hypothetical protein
MKQPESVPSKPKLQSKTRHVETDSEDEARLDEDLSGEDSDQGSSQLSEGAELEDDDDEGVDADAPRVAIWEEDNEDFVAEQDVEENKMSDEVRTSISCRLKLTQMSLFIEQAEEWYESPMSLRRNK